MTPSTPSEFAVRRSFDESEEMAQFLGGWDLDLMQVDGGRFSGEHLIASSGPVLIQEGRTSPTLIQRGEAPEHPTFCVLARAGSRMGVSGREMSADQMLLVRPREGIHVRTEPTFHVFTVTVDGEFLRSVARSLDLERSVDLPTTCKRLTRSAPDLMGGMRSRLLHWSRAMRRFGDCPPTELRRDLDLGVVRGILGVLGQESGGASGETYHALAVIRGVEAAIARRPQHAYRVDELALAVGTSERTLRRAVQAWYGVSPKQLIRTRRLHRVRAALRRGRRDRSRVTNAAFASGFTHLGRFAADYARLFGERPSETAAIAYGEDA